MDGAGRWQLLENASASRVRPGLYEITLSEVSPTWPVRVDLYDGALLRVDGSETNVVTGIRREGSVLVLQATTEPSRP